MNWPKFKNFKCPICGKEKIFLTSPSDWVYKKDGKFFCSWTCYRKYMHKYHSDKNVKDEEYIE
jgi:hypothetical protein